MAEEARSMTVRTASRSTGSTVVHKSAWVIAEEDRIKMALQVVQACRIFQCGPNDLGFDGENWLYLYGQALLRAKSGGSWGYWNLAFAGEETVSKGEFGWVTIRYGPSRPDLFFTKKAPVHVSNRYAGIIIEWSNGTKTLTAHATSHIDWTLPSHGINLRIRSLEAVHSVLRLQNQLTKGSNGVLPWAAGFPQDIQPLVIKSGTHYIRTDMAPLQPLVEPQSIRSHDRARDASIRNMLDSTAKAQVLFSKDTRSTSSDAGTFKIQEWIARKDEGRRLVVKSNKATYLVQTDCGTRQVNLYDRRWRQTHTSPPAALVILTEVLLAAATGKPAPYPANDFTNLKLSAVQLLGRPVSYRDWTPIDDCQCENGEPVINSNTLRPTGSATRDAINSQLLLGESDVVSFSLSSSEACIFLFGYKWNVKGCRDFQTRFGNDLEDLNAANFKLGFDLSLKAFVLRNARSRATYTLDNRVHRLIGWAARVLLAIASSWQESGFPEVYKYGTPLSQIISQELSSESARFQWNEFVCGPSVARPVGLDKRTKIVLEILAFDYEVTIEWSYIKTRYQAPMPRITIASLFKWDFGEREGLQLCGGKRKATSAYLGFDEKTGAFSLQSRQSSLRIPLQDDPDNGLDAVINFSLAFRSSLSNCPTPVQFQGLNFHRIHHTETGEYKGLLRQIRNVQMNQSTKVLTNSHIEG
ncbi:hypothetical protein CF319_g5133 [Tilletia indica]|nr:hypothetical protein CF319_g5133 [Tilletia indica]